MEETEHFAFKFPLDTFFDEEGWEDMYPHWEIKLYVDEENMVEIIDFLLSEEGARKKLKDVFNIMFSGTYRDKLYRKEGIDISTKDITAIKLAFKSNKGGKLNARIYCKEFFEDEKPKFKKIVLLFFLRHKDEQKIPAKTKRKIIQMNELAYLFDDNDTKDTLA